MEEKLLRVGKATFKIPNSILCSGGVQGDYEVHDSYSVAIFAHAVTGNNCGLSGGCGVVDGAKLVKLYCP